MTTKKYNYKITSYNASFSLKEYADRYEEKAISDCGIDKTGAFYAPAFQRNDVWNTKKQSKLIETFLIKLPVPPVYLYKNEKAQHEIIDGYQRIKTLRDFIRGGLKLTGLDSIYNNTTFNKLSDIEKSYFETKMLNCVIVENLDEISNRESLYEIFARLNSGGTNLNNMEIRRAIGWGLFLSEIESFVKTPEWKKIWGEKEAKRYEDVELILRILAFSEKDIDKPMKEFLNLYLEENKDANKLSLLENLKHSIILVLTQYKQYKPFHREKATRTNFALVDSIFPVLIHNKNINNLKEKLNMLIIPITKKDDKLTEEQTLCKEFQEICFKGQGSISKSAVLRRKKIVERIMLA
ncbi:MAG: DUF262 domain-containing protein [Alphaproteobacteria bacterium]